MKVLLVGAKNSEESVRIKSRFEEIGHECKRVYLSDFYSLTNEEGLLSIHHRKVDILHYDVFLFRSIRKFIGEALFLANYLRSKGKRVVDYGLSQNSYNPPLNKLFLSLAGVQYLPLITTSGVKSARDILMEIEHPVIVRNLSSLETYFSEEWTDSYDFVRTSEKKNFSFIPYFSQKEVYKVFIIGNEVVGTLKRVSSEIEPKMHFSPKWKSEGFKETPDQVNIALKIGKILGIEQYSVDLIQKDEKIYLTDFTRAPRFSTLEKIGKINYVDKLVFYVTNLKV